MKYLFRITAFTLLLFNTIHLFATWQTALMWAIPIGMLLFTIYDDVEVRRQINAQTHTNR